MSIKRNRFGAPSPRHMMFAQGRASLTRRHTRSFFSRSRTRQARSMIESHTLSTAPNNFCAKHSFCRLAFFVECALGVHDHAYVLTAAPLIPRTAPPLRQPLENSENVIKMIKCQARRMVAEFELRRALLRRWRRPQNQVEIFKNPWQKSVQFSVPKSATLFWPVHGNNMESLHKTKKYTKKPW